MGGSSTIFWLNMILVILVIAILVLGGIVFLIVLRKKKQEQENSYGEEEKDKNKNNSDKVLGKDSVHKFMEFDEIVDNMIVRKNRTQYVMVIQCKGINYDLLSEAEKEAVENGFTQFLNTLRFPIQLYVQTRSLNLHDIIEQYREKVNNVQLEINQLDARIKKAKIAGNRESAIKDLAIKILNEKYAIKEIDFARSELSFVPAWRAKYVGIDKSMVGGYGQDDRVCSYATIKAISEIDSVEKTAVAMIVDKEEIGSIGNTSMNSQIFDMFVNRLIKKTGTKADILEVYYNSKMLSADVSTCVDPNYDEVSDIQNGNILGCGIALEKYTGSGGKYNSSDANAEFVSQIMSLFEKNNVDFQIGTLGKIGKGGGGTIAYILANKGVDVIDCGTPVLAMHSPFEVASIYDIYATYLAYKTMFKGK